MELYSGYTGGRVTKPDFKRLPMPLIWGEAAIFLSEEEGRSLYQAVEYTPLSFVDEHVTVFHRSLAIWLGNSGYRTGLALHDGIDLSKLKDGES